MLSTDPGAYSTFQSASQDCASDESTERHEEPEDILSASLGVIYNYTPITHAEAGSTFSYTYPGPRVHVNDDEQSSYVKEDRYRRLDRLSDPIKLTLRTPDTQARNWELHASNIWAASVFLADHVEEINLEGFMHVSGGREDCTKTCQSLDILELGAGAGLPGLLIAKYLERDWTVALSDYPDDILIGTLRANVQRNGFDGPIHPENTTSGRNRVHVVPYAWGEDISTLRPPHNGSAGPEGFDLIIAADTLWNASLHEAFAQTLYSALRRTVEARIHLVAGLHTGRYTLAGFIRTVQSINPLEENGAKGDSMQTRPRLGVVNISEREVNGSGVREWEEGRQFEDDSERRRWVVWIVLGWVNL
ncbi:uncharacterized protein FOMMEDRAFT_92330 [Fomitiporia mediterranea MF3/22]|uniref:uncharacterized protein n=1 Tax=Fomitiporia mediterranea (strain MF3/22) TaxID=694068 RepID=UPI0004407C8B|nr:uncharacterized protein FOMMEDRAFT_92330 [Fomitiporia mediterranea MF3/22]EJC99973.1 hypothetical protein FOMMEDRAFT_92330 [Fomitiporia mediterranea MF3/22]